MKIDPYNTKERYLEWKKKSENGITTLNNENSKILLKYLCDMESGLNVSTISKKGARSYIRLYALKTRIIFLFKNFQELYTKKVIDIKEENLHDFFSKMRNGVILRKDGKIFKSAGDFVKDFKAFWHWYQKVNRKKGINIPDLTVDLDTSKDKPKWVYLTEEQIKRLCENSRYDYKVLFTFLFDSGIRAPTELMNVRVTDLSKECKEVHIREEISKTFGRKIKLMICSEMLQRYIKENNLKSEDYLFTIRPETVNKYVKRLAVKIFGDGETEAGGKYSEISLYDFRHISCCYWLPRYKSESALKYRFGWKKSDKIHYYSELLGMKDTITEEDMFIDITKTEIEKQLLKSEKERDMMKEELENLKGKLNQSVGLFEVINQKLSILESMKNNIQSE